MEGILDDLPQSMSKNTVRLVNIQWYSCWCVRSKGCRINSILKDAVSFFYFSLVFSKMPNFSPLQSRDKTTPIIFKKRKKHSRNLEIEQIRRQNLLTLTVQRGSLTFDVFKIDDIFFSKRAWENSYNTSRQSKLRLNNLFKYIITMKIYLRYTLNYPH